MWEEGVGGARDERRDKRRDERRDVGRTHPPTTVEGEEQEEERRHVSGERKEVATVKEEVSGQSETRKPVQGERRRGREGGERKSLMRRGREGGKRVCKD